MRIDERQGVGMVRVTVHGARWLRWIELAGNLLGLWGTWQIWQRGGTPLHELLLISLGMVWWVGRSTRPAVQRVDLCLDGRLTVVMASGRRVTGRLDPRQYVTSWLIILHWRAENGRRQAPLVMTGQGMTADEWRRFRVLLRHPL